MFKKIVRNKKQREKKRKTHLGPERRVWHRLGPIPVIHMPRWVQARGWGMGCIGSKNHNKLIIIWLDIKKHIEKVKEKSPRARHIYHHLSFLFPSLYIILKH
jgi:hypothetical protein